MLFFFYLDFVPFVQFSCCRVRLFVTPWTVACQASLSVINAQSLLKLMSIESMMPFSHIILCRPLFLPPSIFPSIRVFSNQSVLRNMWPKYWSFSFNINPSNEYSGLISFRMDWLDLLAVQGTLKSLLQHYSSKELILQHSAFFRVHWEGDQACSLMFTAWPMMESSSVCFLLHCKNKLTWVSFS